MSAHYWEDGGQGRKKVSFELDSATFASLRGIAFAEHRTLSAQLRVIVEDFVAENSGE